MHRTTHTTHNTNTTHTAQQNRNNLHSTAFSNTQQSLPLRFEVHVSMKTGVVRHKMPFSQFFHSCHDHEKGPKFTSLSQTRAWLKTLPDVSEDVELRRIQETVQVLQKPTHQALVHICAQWQQAQQRKGKHLPVAVIVLDASNSA